MQIAAEWLSDPAVAKVMAMFADAGHRAWFVGGCVRNAVIGAGASDVDIATDALPDQVIALADAAGMRSVPTGIGHGTVTLVVEGQPHEVTTLRRDIETHGRHATVAFGTSLEEDAARRDFTMNALYATSDGVVIDPLGQGIDDLRAGRVRFIGDASARIAEDYLRILRFFRFNAWYGDPGGGIDPEGLAACADALDGISRLSRERVGGEMHKLLAAPDPAPAVGAMVAAGVLLRVLPGAGVQTLAVLVHVEGAAGLQPEWLRRLAALGGQDADTALRLSRAEARRLARLRHGMAQEWDARETGYRLGLGDGVDVLALRAALAGREIAPDALQGLRDGAAQEFPVRAADLPPGMSGVAVGQALARLESHWIASGFTPDRDTLLAWLAANGESCPGP